MNSIPPPPPSPPRPYQATMTPDYQMGAHPHHPPPPPSHSHDPGLGQSYGQHKPSPETFYAEPQHMHFDPHAQQVPPTFVELAPPQPTYKNGKLVSIYAGYVFTILDPAQGQPRTWTRAKLQKMDKDQTALLAMVKKDFGKGNKAKEIFASKELAGAKRSQIEHLLFHHQGLEMDHQVEWIPAMIKLEKVKGQEQATKSMQVIIKRTQKSPIVHSGRRESRGSFGGGFISDLNARPFQERPSFSGHHDPIITVGGGHGQYHHGQRFPDQHMNIGDTHGPQHVHAGPGPMEAMHDAMHRPREPKYPAGDPSRAMPMMNEPIHLADGAFDAHYDDVLYSLDDHFENEGGKEKKKDKKEKKDKKDKKDKHQPEVHQSGRPRVHPYPTNMSDSEPDSLFHSSDNEQGGALYTPDSSICGEQKGRRRSSYYKKGTDPKRHAHESSKHQRARSENLDGDPYVVVGKGPSLRRHDSINARPTNYRRESHLEVGETEWRRRREDREREEREGERALARIEGKLEAMRMVEQQERGRDRPLSDRPYDRDRDRDRDREYPYEGGRGDRHRDRNYPPRGSFGRDYGRDYGRSYGRDYDQDYDNRDRDRGYGGFSRR